MLHAKQVVAPRRGLHALLRRVVELAQTFHAPGSVRFARGRIDTAKIAIDGRHSRATKRDPAHGSQKLLCIDPDDRPQGHCPRALLDPVSQLAVKHREQRQDEVGLSEARSLVVDTDEDLGDVLLRGLLILRCRGLANVDRREAVSR